MKVVGITGTIGSGKEIIREILLKKFNSYHVNISDIIKGEIEKKRGKLDRKTLQDMGNEMRQKYGSHILALLAIEYLPRAKELTVVTGIRNPAETEYLRKKFGQDYKLIAIDAPIEVRFERVLKRQQNNDPQTFEEFLSVDERDQGKGEPESGLQVRKCIEQADFKIINDGTIEDLEKKLNEIIPKL